MNKEELVKEILSSEFDYNVEIYNEYAKIGLMKQTKKKLEEIYNELNEVSK